MNVIKTVSYHWLSLEGSDGNLFSQLNGEVRLQCRVIGQHVFSNWALEY